MVGVPQVQLGEHTDPLEELEHQGDEWKQVSVSDRDFIEALEVNAWPQGLVLLIDEKKNLCWREDEGLIILPARDASMYSLMASISRGGKGVEASFGGQVDRAIVGAVRRRGGGLGLTEDLLEVMVTLGN